VELPRLSCSDERWARKTSWADSATPERAQLRWVLSKVVY